ncbi:hypothetical protein [Thermoanaerobaculum aquaticum]|uniref:hypothetical protein n=1 Tax=Thermoanaerobaculum aquaticum TaxID=1312852 RepID=UPI0012684296|nr:hypothetical protein [Thermoanaerobaculum aquaticum]
MAENAAYAAKAHLPNRTSDRLFLPPESVAYGDPYHRMGMFGGKAKTVRSLAPRKKPLPRNGDIGCSKQLSELQARQETPKQN